MPSGAVSSRALNIWKILSESLTRFCAAIGKERLSVFWPSGTGTTMNFVSLMRSFLLIPQASAAWPMMLIISWTGDPARRGESNLSGDFGRR